VKGEKTVIRSKINLPHGHDRVQCEDCTLQWSVNAGKVNSRLIASIVAIMDFWQFLSGTLGNKYQK
jgi:hypothetical protein